MSAKMYFTVTSVLFFLIFVLHSIRIVLHWEAIIGGGHVPMWASIVGLVISGYLAFSGFKLRKSA